jgi:methionyl-tRNA formyltransferase
MRILFFGTPAFAAHSLSAFINSKHQIVGVVTAPDKPAGRGRTLKVSAVKQLAAQHGLKVLQPPKLKNLDFLEALKQLKPDLAIVVAFRMLPKEIWSLPPLGTINLHASLLPEYRGAAPINWVLINGEKKTGVTTFFINEDIDTGAILLQKELAIAKDETAGTLHDKLMTTGAELLLETTRKLEQNNLNAQQQGTTNNLATAPKIFKKDQKLSFNQNAKQVYNYIRALSPYPVAYATLRQNDTKKNVKIYQALLTHKKTEAKPGTVKTDGKTFLEVACADEWLSITELQLAGKKRMETAALLNGFVLQQTATLE